MHQLDYEPRKRHRLVDPKDIPQIVGGLVGLAFMSLVVWLARGGL